MQKNSYSTAFIILSAGLILFFAGFGAARFFGSPSVQVVMPGNGRGAMPMGSGMGGSMMHMADIKNDADFLMEMIPHHQEAVDTSRYALGKTQDEEMRVFLQNIVDVQTAEIEQMKRWHQEWYGTEYKNDGRYRAMMPDLSRLEDNQVIPAYLHGMIMHHMGAVEMARTVLPLTERDVIRNFARDIIRVQNEEITRMLEWLAERASGQTSMMRMMH